MLDVRRLRVLREVARRGSFSAAAQALSFTQPAISRQIAALELEAGAQLVDRRARGVRLTPAGELLLEHADVILDRLAAAENQLEALAEVPHTAMPTVESPIVPVSSASGANDGSRSRPISRTAAMASVTPQRPAIRRGSASPVCGRASQRPAMPTAPMCSQPSAPVSIRRSAAEVKRSLGPRRRRIDPGDRPGCVRLQRLLAQRPATTPGAAREEEERAAPLGRRLEVAAMLGRELGSEMPGEVHGHYRAGRDP